MMHPSYVTVAPCDAQSVLVCTGVEQGYLAWAKIAISNLPDYLARLNDLEHAVFDEVAGAPV